MSEESSEVPMPMAMIRARLSLTPSFFSAMKIAMGKKREHMGFLSEFVTFIREHPKFKFADVYHPSSCECSAAACVKRRAKREQKRIQNEQPVGA